MNTGVSSQGLRLARLVFYLLRHALSTSPAHSVKKFFWQYGGLNSGLCNLLSMHSTTSVMPPALFCSSYF
jgi:hypothetical protein